MHDSNANNHYGHGTGTAEHGPDDSDCPCRGNITLQTECAKTGCGFCIGAFNVTIGQSKLVHLVGVVSMQQILARAMEIAKEHIIVFRRVFRHQKHLNRTKQAASKQREYAYLDAMLFRYKRVAKFAEYRLSRYTDGINSRKLMTQMQNMGWVNPMKPHPLEK